MRTGSLFSGYDGLGLAVDELFPGNTREWFCEWDDAPSKILTHHWPTVPNFRDVTEVDWAAIPPVDILTGGYPCQPFSAAGRRKGTDDERHLWPYVREAIRHLRPRFTLLENVAGHRSLGFDRVLGDLAEDGMHVRWTSIRASDIGAPHHRERVFILVTDPSYAAGHREWSRTESDEGTEGATDSSSRGPSSINDRAVRDATCPGRVRIAGGGARVPLPTDSGSSAVWEHPRESPAQETRSVAGDGSIDHCGERSDRNGREGAAIAEGIGLIGRRTAPERTGGTHATVDRHSADIQWGAYAPAIRRWERLTRPAPSPTLPNSNGRPQLNAAFAEWMMGVPDGHVTSVPISRAYQLKAIGNGVCPPQAVAAYSSLLAQAVAA